MGEVDGHVGDLRAYYEQEAALRTRKPPAGRRVAIRTQYLALLADEGRPSVLDLGAGPGGDGPAFAAAGIRYVGLDLAYGNAGLAAESGVVVVPGSIGAPPFRPGSFQAGWSMSTLMHVPEAQVPGVLAAMVEPLAAGAPLFVGLWGGRRHDHVVDNTIPGHRRLFSYRPVDQNRRLLSTVGAVEHEEAWEVTPDGAANGMQYQVFRLRLPAG